jgi:membrane protein implicated in regulation of membrane protease activity
MILYLAVSAGAIWLLVSIFGSSLATKITMWAGLAFAAFLYFQWLRQNEEEKTRERQRILDLERRVKETDERPNRQSRIDRLGGN